MLPLIFLIAALILFIIAAIGVSCRINLTAAGLACWVLSQIIGSGLLR